MSLRNDFIKIKAILIGNEGVGKKLLLAHEEIQDGTKQYTDIPEAQGQTVQVKFFCDDGKKYYQSSNEQLIFIIYDVTNEASFISARFYHSNNNLSNNAIHILIGNKADAAGRVISTEKGQALGKELGIPFFEVSAKTGSNVSNAFRAGLSSVCNPLQPEPVVQGFFAKIYSAFITLLRCVKNWFLEDSTTDARTTTTTFSMSGMYSMLGAGSKPSVPQNADTTAQQTENELLPPILRYGRSFVTQRRETSTTPHFGQFLTRGQLQGPI